MMKLGEILKVVDILEVRGDLDLPVSSLCFDSRKARNGCLFIAVRGTLADGHDYIHQAVEKGAVAVLCERFPARDFPGVTLARTADTAHALGVAASRYYADPSRQLRLVGVTGTNGKTTVATMLYRLFSGAGMRSGLVSTICNRIGEKELDSNLTTPDPVELNELFQEMLKSECRQCFMEVSSHALDQKRIAGLSFSGGIFTNITHDHLDYHKTFRNYIGAKKTFFDGLPEDAFALVNRDDKNHRIMVQNTAARVRTFSVRSGSDYKSRVLENHFEGMLLEINREQVWAPFAGEYNAANLAAVYGTASEMGWETRDILKSISRLRPVRGRLEVVCSGDVTAIVDYAHTPDALLQVLKTIRQIRKGSPGRLFTVVGAGGDRDRKKRPDMGKVAVRNSERVLLTSDNPRSEDPADIIGDMVNGLSERERRKVLKIPDREEAIRTALMMAGKGDVVLVAGKGHETSQEIMGKKLTFDDRRVILKYCRKEN